MNNLCCPVSTHVDPRGILRAHYGHTSGILRADCQTNLENCLVQLRARAAVPKQRPVLRSRVVDVPVGEGIATAASGTPEGFGVWLVGVARLMVVEMTEVTV